MRSLPLALAVCFLSACAKTPAVDTEGARTALRQADSAYSRAGVAKDRATFVALYAPDAVVYPPGGETVSGIDAIGKFMDGPLTDTSFTAVFHPVTVDVSTDGTLGYTLNAAQLSSRGTDGKRTTERVRDFHVWRKQPDGTWKLLIDIWNAEPTATPPKP
jgi:uncharacterized protein (TIGR02246 family)